MKFDHLVRHNGVDYPAGTEVPVGSTIDSVVESFTGRGIPKEETKQNVEKTAETAEPQSKGSKNSKKA